MEQHPGTKTLSFVDDTEECAELRIDETTVGCHAFNYQSETPGSRGRSLRLGGYLRPELGAAVFTRNSPAKDTSVRKGPCTTSDMLRSIRALPDFAMRAAVYTV